MKAKLSEWLHRDIRIPVRKHSQPSALCKKLGRVFRNALLLLLAAFVLWRLLLYREVSGRFAKLRQEGLPASGAELNVWRGELPDAQNGAGELLKAFLLVRTFPDSRSNLVVEPKLLERSSAWSPPTNAMIAEYVELNKPALGAVREALKFPGFRFPVDFAFGPDTPLAHLVQLKRLASIVALQSCSAAENGNERASAEAVVALLQLARTLDDEPIAISFLVRCSLIQMVAKATERNLNRTEFQDASAAHLQRAFATSQASNLLSRAFIGERATMSPVFRLSKAEVDAVSRGDEDGTPSHRPPLRYAGKPNLFLWATGFMERDLNFYLQTMERSISVAALPPPECLALTNVLDRAAACAKKRYFVMSAMLLPAFTKISVRDAMAGASIRLAMTGLAIERFRQGHGRIPQDLTELTPEVLGAVPRDPFDGKPLRYRTLARGYVVYSVGSDGHDDGGREPPERKKSSDKTSYDITFIVER